MQSALPVAGMEDIDALDAEREARHRRVHDLLDRLQDVHRRQDELA